jgi:hypothetical protein
MHDAVRRVLPKFELTILLAIAACVAARNQTRSVLSAEPSPQISSQPTPPILQLRSGSEIARFLPAKAYLLASGHALTVEFLGTPGVMPRNAERPDLPAGTARKVFYEDLWPGVSLTIRQDPKGNCDTTYLLAPGADAAKIRLRYNVPVRLQKDGTLKFHFSSGSVTASSPEAWQHIGDSRRAVAVSFAISNGEVGFVVGNYDRSIPLTIDPAYRTSETRVNRFPLQRGEKPHVFQLNPVSRLAVPAEAANNQVRLRTTDEQPEKGIAEDYANRE